jgi:hypothetical protein
MRTKPSSRHVSFNTRRELITNRSVTTHSRMSSTPHSCYFPIYSWVYFVTNVTGRVKTRRAPRELIECDSCECAGGNQSRTDDNLFSSRFTAITVYSPPPGIHSVIIRLFFKFWAQIRYECVEKLTGICKFSKRETSEYSVIWIKFSAEMEFECDNGDEWRKSRGLTKANTSRKQANRQ